MCCVLDKNYPVKSLEGRNAYCSLFSYQVVLVLQKEATQSYLKWDQWRAVLSFFQKEILIKTVVGWIESVSIIGSADDPLQETYEVCFLINPRLKILASRCNPFVTVDTFWRDNFLKLLSGVYPSEHVHFDVKFPDVIRPYTAHIPGESDFFCFERWMFLAGWHYWIEVDARNIEILHIADHLCISRNSRELGDEWYEADITISQDQTEVVKIIWLTVCDLDFGINQVVHVHWSEHMSAVIGKKSGYYRIAEISIHVKPDQSGIVRMRLIEEGMSVFLWHKNEAVIPSCSIAHTEGTQSSGCYRIRHMWDKCNHSFGHASAWVPRMSAYGGESGEALWNTPLLSQSAVVLSYLNGDPDQPIILGMLHEKFFSNPITEKNRTQYAIQSNKNHEILIDDAKEKPFLQMKNEGNRVVFDVLDGALMQSESGEVSIFSADDMYVCAQTVEKFAQKNYEVIVQNDYRSFVKKESYFLSNDIHEHSASRDYYLSSANRLALRSAQDIDIKAEQRIEIRVDGNEAIWKATDGDCFLRAYNIHIVVAADGAIQFRCGTAEIVMDVDNNVIFSGSRLHLAATQTVLCRGEITHDLVKNRGL